MRAKIKMFHVNMLKLHVELEPTNMCISAPEYKVSFVATVSVIDLENGDTDGVDNYESRTNVLQHGIKLTSDDPIRYKPYPIPYAMLETVNNEVDEMIEMDINERSDSPYASPFVIVKKKDQSTRFCIDFRGLNSITIFDAETMARPSKCYVAYNNLEVLGHIVGTDRLSPNPDKIEVIKNDYRPTTKKQVRSFIGMAEFYKKFVPDFSDIASPLTDLTKNGQPNQVRWEVIHEKVFSSLKNALVQTPVLKLSNFSQVFILQTDASDKGIGAILLQDEVSLDLQSKIIRIGRTINLTCTVHGIDEIDNKLTRQWSKGLDIISYNGHSTIADKYNEILTSWNQFKMEIYNVSESDVNCNYKCRYGFESHVKRIQLSRNNFECKLK
ncbi:unnamed protein product [Mytilus coruscus]|uniref:Reverse transcriptase/retrotransposon-derived protein RNase H-like domain-containing protein n=1 Tax=Mytilus coruscus TaxID=42192 RepID=A0A6J8BLY1_MYTCO|nr:unnamed protein product [Mytilus coruscus]